MVVGMTAPALHLHNKRNLLFCIGGMWLLFSIGAGTVLSIAPKNFLSEAVPRLPLSLELGVGLMLFVGPLAVLIGFCVVDASSSDFGIALFWRIES